MQTATHFRTACSLHCWDGEYNVNKACQSIFRFRKNQLQAALIGHTLHYSQFNRSKCWTQTFHLFAHPPMKPVFCLPTESQPVLPSSHKPVLLKVQQWLPRWVRMHFSRVALHLECPTVQSARCRATRGFHRSSVPTETSGRALPR